MDTMDESTEEVQRSRRGVIRLDVDPVLLPGGIREGEYESESLYMRLFVAVTLPRRAIRVLDGMSRSMREVSYDGMHAAAAFTRCDGVRCGSLDGAREYAHDAEVLG